MRLREQVLFPQARLKEVKIQLSEEEPKLTFTFRAPLPIQTAEIVGCRDLLFAGDVPRSGVKKMELDGEDIDAEIRMKNDNFAFDAVTNSINRYVVRLEGTGPVLEFRVHLKGYADLVPILLTKVKVDPLEVTLNPAQRNLDLKQENAETETKEEAEGPAEEEDALAGVTVQ